MVWTADQINTTILELGGIIGSIATIIKMSHDRKEETINSNNNANNSTSNDLVHKIIDNKANTVNVEPPADIEIKSTTETAKP